MQDIDKVSVLMQVVIFSFIIATVFHA